MVWFQVDDTLAYHQKVRDAGNAAMGLWVRAGAWSAQTLTDGFIPSAVARSIGTQSQIKRLVNVNLWERVDGGYRFHQWERQQVSKAEVEARREAERLRKANQRKGKYVPPGQPPDVPPDVQEGVPPDVPPDVQEESRQESLVHARALPNPTQPFPSSNGHLGGVSNGELDPATPPPKFCPKHMPNGTTANCGACRQAREQHESWESAQVLAEATRRAVFRREVAECPDCDEKGWTDTDDGVERCPNHDWERAHA